MEYFTWILSLHVIFVISWMSALFYLPRLFVYHMENIDNAGFVEVVKIQEQKLYKYIAIPAFWIAFLSGLTMLFLHPQVFSTGGWMHAKLTFVFLMIVYHFSLGVFMKKLANGTCKKSGKFFRMYNEVPTLLMFGIVIMVVVRPF